MLEAGHFYHNHNFHLHLNLLGEFLFCPIDLSVYSCTNINVIPFQLGSHNSYSFCRWFLEGVQGGSTIRPSISQSKDLEKCWWWTDPNVIPVILPSGIHNFIDSPPLECEWGLWLASNQWNTARLMGCHSLTLPKTVLLADVLLLFCWPWRSRGLCCELWSRAHDKELWVGSGN